MCGVYTPEEIRGVYTAEEMLGDIVEQTNEHWSTMTGTRSAPSCIELEQYRTDRLWQRSSTQVQAMIKAAVDTLLAEIEGDNAGHDIWLDADHRDESLPQNWQRPKRS